MPVPVTSQFRRKMAMPLDYWDQVLSLDDRNTIPSGERWEGMLVYVVQEGETFRLTGGTSNSQWAVFGEGSGGDTGGLQKSVLEVTGDESVNWNTAAPGGGGQTFAQKHGNNFTAQAYWDRGGGLSTSYAVGIGIQRDGSGSITSVEFSNVQPGTIVII